MQRRKHIQCCSLTASFISSIYSLIDMALFTKGGKQTVETLRIEIITVTDLYKSVRGLGVFSCSVVL